MSPADNIDRTALAEIRSMLVGAQESLGRAAREAEDFSGQCTLLRTGLPPGGNGGGAPMIEPDLSGSSAEPGPSRDPEVP